MEHCKQRIESYRKQVKAYAELLDELQVKNWKLTSELEVVKSLVKAFEDKEKTYKALIKAYEDKCSLLELQSKCNEIELMIEGKD